MLWTRLRMTHDALLIGLGTNFLGCQLFRSSGVLFWQGTFFQYTSDGTKVQVIVGVTEPVFTR